MARNFTPESGLVGIFDFDGLISDEWYNAKELSEKQPGFVAGVLGLHTSEVEPYLLKKQKVIDKHPGAEGWEIDGTKIASADNSLYLYLQTRLQLALPDMAKDGLIKKPSPEQTQLILNLVHGLSYDAVKPVPRPGAAEFQIEMNRLIDLYFLSNSSTRRVEAAELDIFTHSKYGVQALENFNALRGGGGKHILDQRFTTLPEKVKVPNYPRKYYVRRSKLITAANSIRPDVPNERKIAAGDNTEMDFLPLALLGMNGVLMKIKGHTVKAEADYVESLKFGDRKVGHVVQSLGELANHVRYLTKQRPAFYSIPNRNGKSVSPMVK